MVGYADAYGSVMWHLRHAAYTTFLTLAVAWSDHGKRLSIETRTSRSEISTLASGIGLY